MREVCSGLHETTLGIFLPWAVSPDDVLRAGRGVCPVVPQHSLPIPQDQLRPLGQAATQGPGGRGLPVTYPRVSALSSDCARCCVPSCSKLGDRWDRGKSRLPPTWPKVLTLSPSGPGVGVTLTRLGRKKIADSARFYISCPIPQWSSWRYPTLPGDSKNADWKEIGLVEREEKSSILVFRLGGTRYDLL